MPRTQVEPHRFFFLHLYTPCLEEPSKNHTKITRLWMLNGQATYRHHVYQLQL
ncbi:hypothetical protein JG688_00007750 [Phytophthora aleatoria]|uniref:Uncharacterized protein n=1 Tax=Phytophthora aleatoria TaxID=2496075 RepID=A0A8J5J5K0_9STRA|nr:hypothetical protein JG688_00007750 [Phytophthora aleatoria]